MVCGLSLSHIHSQLCTLLFLKWGGQCLLPSSCLTCICQIYIVFPWNPIKNVPFQLSSPHPCFYLPWRESCTIWWKKKLLAWKGRGKHCFYDLSQPIYSIRGKKMNQRYWKQMLTLCWLLRMGRVDSVVAVTKGYWWQSGTLWWITFPSVGGEQKLHGTKNEVTLWF